MFFNGSPWVTETAQNPRRRNRSQIPCIYRPFDVVLLLIVGSYICINALFYIRFIITLAENIMIHVLVPFKTISYIDQLTIESRFVVTDPHMEPAVSIFPTSLLVPVNRK